MLVQKLLDHFDNSVDYLHVDVNDVRDKLVEMGVQDRIQFHFVKMEVARLRGLLDRRIEHGATYATPTLCSDIILPRDMGDESEAWHRLVAVKELLHITDCDKLTAASPNAVDNLFKKFSMPPELRASGDDEQFSSSFLNDRVRIWFALAVLVPGKPRDALRSSRLTPREIAEIAKIPVRYVPQVMSEGFDSLIGTLIKWELSAQVD